MNLFPFGHATHPQWPMAAGLVIAQLRAQMTLPGHATSPRLGLLYITDFYANDAEAILAHLQQENKLLLKPLIMALQLFGLFPNLLAPEIGGHVNKI